MFSRRRLGAIQAMLVKQGLNQQQTSAGEPITIDEMLKLQCDIFIPAAVPDVIDEKVARELNCRYVVEAANGPTTVEGDKVTAHLPRLMDILWPDCHPADACGNTLIDLSSLRSQTSILECHCPYDLGVLFGSARRNL